MDSKRWPPRGVMKATACMLVIYLDFPPPSTSGARHTPLPVIAMGAQTRDDVAILIALFASAAASTKDAVNVDYAIVAPARTRNRCHEGSSFETKITNSIKTGNPGGLPDLQRGGDYQDGHQLWLST
jgi:hypothetical protein